MLNVRSLDLTNWSTASQLAVESLLPCSSITAARDRICSMRVCRRVREQVRHQSRMLSTYRCDFNFGKKRFIIIWAVNDKIEAGRETNSFNRID